jgi:hypothetical protein
MPERSAAISGDEKKGLTPISAVQNDEEAASPGDNTPVSPPTKPVVLPVAPRGVLEHLADRS